MDLGKLTGVELSKIILSRLKAVRPEVVLGAKIGEDTCAIRTPDVVVMSTDPITAADAHVGFFAMHINANDIAASGAEPFAALVTIMMPPKCGEEAMTALVDELAEAAASLGIDIIGGHTEVTDAVTRTVVSVTMLGLPAVPGHIVMTGGMRSNDSLIMTKYAAIEGTLILADTYAEQLHGVLDEQDKEQLELMRSFISVVPEGIIGAQDRHVSAMHDITEGGVIGAVQEMCAASGIGAEIDTGRIPMLPVTRKICSMLEINPARIISSGSMLIAVSDQSRLMEVLADKGIPATVIGHACPEQGLRDRNTGELLLEQASDALYDTHGKGHTQ